MHTSRENDADRAPETSGDGRGTCCEETDDREKNADFVTWQVRMEGGRSDRGLVVAGLANGNLLVLLLLLRPVAAGDQSHVGPAGVTFHSHVH